VDARDVEVLRDDDLGRVERLIGLAGVAGLPVPDVVGLLLAVRADQRSVRLQRLDRVHDGGQRLVLDVDQRDGVGGDVAVGGDDGGDLLRLVDHTVHRQDHLLVAHQGGHPGEAGGVEVFAGDDGEHAGQRERLAGVNVEDFGVGVGAAGDVHVEHTGQLDVVYVVAAAAQEAGVFLALDAVAHAAYLSLRWRRHACLTSAPTAAATGAVSAALIFFAAYWMDLTMLT